MRSDEINIHDYVRVLIKRRWVAVAFFLIVFISVSVATFVMTPVYKATALVYIDPGVNSQMAFQQSPYPLDNTVYLQTQIGILKSDVIARKVINKVGIDRISGAGEDFALSPFRLLGLLGVGEAANPDREKEERAVGVFLDNLDVAAVKNSNLVKVSYEAVSPELAAQVANVAVQTFIEQSLEMKVAPAKEAMAWLNDKMGEIKGKMSESSSQLQDFKQEKGLIVTGDKESNISIQSLTELNAQALAAEAKRYDAEVRYQQVKRLSGNSEGILTAPSVLNNQVVQGLRSQLAAMEKQKSEQSKKFGAKHPQMIRLDGEIDTLKKQIGSEVALIVDSLKNEYDSSLRAEQGIKSALGRQKSEAMSYERRSTEYDIMNQDVEGARNIYDTVLKKFQESNLMGNISMSNVQFLDRAKPPLSPARPKKALNILIGFVMGVVTGVGIAFVFEYIDNTYKSPEDIEEYLGLPFLGMVPTNKSLQGGKKDANLVGVSNPKSQFAEAFRGIRSSLLLSTGDNTPKVVQVCSAVHSEGKSTVAANLSCIMAAAGERVLLIDADMRRPRLHKAFKMQNVQGLSSILTRQVTLDAALKQTAISGLTVISSGPISPNPSELIGSNAMKELIADAREQYDRVIIDCPPYLGLSDALMLTPQTDGVLLVVRSGKTSKDLVVKTKKGFDLIKARILGVVLNDQTSMSEDYYYRYNYNYYYGDNKSKSA